MVSIKLVLVMLCQVRTYGNIGHIRLMMNLWFAQIVDDLESSFLNLSVNTV